MPDLEGAPLQCVICEAHALSQHMCAGCVLGVLVLRLGELGLAEVPQSLCAEHLNAWHRFNTREGLPSKPCNDV